MTNPQVAQQARQMVDRGAVLLDVRTPQEFGNGHLPGALNIPVQELGGRMTELPSGKAVVVYCASGMRSANAEQMLRKAGFSEVLNLGPMSAWK